MSTITIIDLHIPYIDCAVCGLPDVSRWGLAVWEGEIVPDDHAGEWGGAPCCERCYRAWQSGTIKPWMTFNQARQAVELRKGSMKQDREKRAYMRICGEAYSRRPAIALLVKRVGWRRGLKWFRRELTRRY